MALRDEARNQSLKLNFPALFSLFVLFLIWTALSSVWLPAIAWLISLLQPVVWFLGEILLGLGLVLMFGFALAAVVLLLAGVIPRSL